MAGGEPYPAEVVGKPHECGREHVRRRLVESPVRQRDPAVHTLQLALQIEQIGAVPGQEGRSAVGFAARLIDVGVAVLAEDALALAVERGQRGEEPVALDRAEPVGVLAHPHHQRMPGQHRTGGLAVGDRLRFDRHVAVFDAGEAELAADPELHRPPVRGQHQVDAVLAQMGQRRREAQAARIRVRGRAQPDRDRAGWRRR